MKDGQDDYSNALQCIRKKLDFLRSLLQNCRFAIWGAMKTLTAKDAKYSFGCLTNRSSHNQDA